MKDLLSNLYSQFDSSVMFWLEWLLLLFKYRVISRKPSFRRWNCQSHTLCSQFLFFFNFSTFPQMVFSQPLNLSSKPVIISSILNFLHFIHHLFIFYFNKVIWWMNLTFILNSRAFFKLNSVGVLEGCWNRMNCSLSIYDLLEFFYFRNVLYSFKHVLFLQAAHSNFIDHIA